MKASAKRYHGLRPGDVAGKASDPHWRPMLGRNDGTSTRKESFHAVRTSESSHDRKWAANTLAGFDRGLRRDRARRLRSRPLNEAGRGAVRIPRGARRQRTNHRSVETGHIFSEQRIDRQRRLNLRGDRNRLRRRSRKRAPHGSRWRRRQRPDPAGGSGRRRRHGNDRSRAGDSRGRDRARRLPQSQRHGHNETVKAA